MSNDYTVNPVGIIRTIVPTAVGAVLSWLAIEYGVVIDDAASQGLVAGFTSLLASIYYVVVRFAEKHVPALGWLLGSPTAPVYPDAPSGSDLIPLTEANRMVEDAVTEVYRQIEVGGDE